MNAHSSTFAGGAARADGSALAEHFRRADRVMLAIGTALFVYSLALAFWHDTWLQALLIGGGTLALLFVVYQLAPGSVVSRIAMAAGFMVFTALHINQSDGMIEMHFGVFVLFSAYVSRVLATKVTFPLLIMLLNFILVLVQMRLQRRTK